MDGMSPMSVLAVRFITAFLIALGTVTGIVAHVGAAQSEAQQVQVADDGQHRLIDAELGVAQTLDHNGCVDQGDEGAESQRNVGQNSARPNLIDLQEHPPFHDLTIYYTI